MALVTKMNRCAVCGSSQISLMADGKYYHCEACGATSNHTMPAADLAKVDRISLMGGGAYTGNWTPAAEYNIYVDPEAASIVFNSGVPIVMAGLDVTHQAYITREENEILRQKGGRIAVFAAELIDFFSRYHYEVEKLPGCTIHDACAVAYLCHPEIFVEKQCHVDIELEGSLTAGTTVCDPGNYEGKEKNATVLYGVDREKFAELFIEAMSKLDK